MNTSDARPTCVLIGLDGASFPILETLWNRNAAQTILGIYREGSAVPLESQIPPWTASAWPTMYTGTNPGKHGVYDFLTFDGYDWEVVNASHVTERPIWKLLSDHGLRSVIVNVPVTHPATAFDGVLIPGMTAPEGPPCHPKGLLSEVERACGSYRVYPESFDGSEDSTEAYVDTIERRGEAFRYLLSEYEPDFGFVQFQQTDSVFHEHPGNWEIIESVYDAVDSEIDTILETFDPENVLIVSDHGMRKVTGYEFRVNEYLKRLGYLRTTRSGTGMPTWTNVWRSELLAGSDSGEYSPGLIERGFSGLARVGLTTQRIARALDVVGLKEPIGKRVPNSLIRTASEQVDFNESLAFLRSKSELGIRLNVMDREPNGQIPQSDYAEVRSAIIESLTSVKTPDGESLFSSVEPRETYFHGEEIDRGPDIVIVPDGFNHAVAEHVDEALFEEPTEPWNHSKTGILIGQGSSIDTTTTIEEASILDIAPTLCGIFDVPADERMDGSVVSFAPEAVRSSYPAYARNPISMEDTDQAEERLKDLGYL